MIFAGAWERFFLVGVDAGVLLFGLARVFVLTALFGGERPAKGRSSYA